MDDELNPTPDGDNPTLDPRWDALFTAPTPPFDRVWRAMLGEAQRAEEAALLRYWAQRPSRGRRAA